jgi:hypothetical protein
MLEFPGNHICIMAVIFEQIRNGLKLMDTLSLHVFCATTYELFSIVAVSLSFVLSFLMILLSSS